MIYLALLLTLLLFAVLIYFFEEFMFERIKAWSVRWFFASNLWLLILVLLMQYVEIIKGTMYEEQILMMLTAIENIFGFFIFLGSGIVLGLFFVMFIHIVVLVSQDMLKKIKKGGERWR